jgi:hypothetical protein
MCCWLMKEKKKTNWWTIYFDIEINICGNGANTIIIFND